MEVTFNTGLLYNIERERERERERVVRQLSKRFGCYIRSFQTSKIRFSQFHISFTAFILRLNYGIDHIFEEIKSTF